MLHVGVLGLSLSIWLFLTGLLLFGALVLVWFVFHLVRDAKRLAEDLRSAASRLETARQGVSAEAASVRAKAGRIKEAGFRSRRRER